MRDIWAQLDRAFGENGHTASAAVGATILKGARNATLTSIAGSLRRRGGTPDEVERCLAVFNERCEIPLDAHEVATIARSVGRYEPGADSFLSLEGKKEKKVSMLAWRTAREVATAAPERPDFIAPPYLVAGEITGIAGKLKVGKSTLTAHLIQGTTSGGTFLGQPCKRGPVLMLTEQRPGRLRELLERAGLLECEDLHILHLRDAKGAPWPEVAASAVEKARSEGAIVLVVDTISRFARIVDENDAGQMNAAMTPLEDAAAAGLGIWVPHHERKSGGSVEDAGRGSSAFGGAVDILLRLRRGEGATPKTVRVLEALSRFDATPEQLAIELVDGSYVARGPEGDVTFQQAKVALDGALTAEPATLEELKERLDGVKDKTLRKALGEAVRDGKAVRLGEGKKGSPYKWEALSFPTPIIGVEKEKNPSEHFWGDGCAHPHGHRPCSRAAGTAGTEAE